MKMQPAHRIVEISEWSTIELAGRSLSHQDRRLVELFRKEDNARLTVEEMRHGLRIVTRSWVGVVRFESFEVRIVPKLAGNNSDVVNMIETTTGLDVIRPSRGIQELHAKSPSLFDLIALLFSEACEKLLKGGLFSDYVVCEEELPSVRGRILADRQILKRFGRVDRVHCRFDELEQDVIENRLLAAALSLCGKLAVNFDVKRRIRRLQTVFNEICTPSPLDAAAVRRELTYHRLNEHYRDAHKLAWLVIDNLGVSDIFGGGELPCFAFLLDMNRLFEQFITFVCANWLKNDVYRVSSQHNDRSIIWNVETGRPYTRVIPDILIESPEHPAKRVTVDAKYKLYNEKRVSTADIYQGFLYAFAYNSETKNELSVSILVYPSSDKANRITRLRVQGRNGMKGAEITVLGLSLPRLIEETVQNRQGPTVSF